MQARTVVLVATLSLTTGWLIRPWSVAQAPESATGASSARSGPRPLGSGPRPLGNGPRPLGSAPREPLAPYTEQLRLKMQDVPRSPSRGRNPFSFGARHAPMAASRGSRNVEAEAIEAPSAPPVFVARQRFELSGIASSERDGKSTLTAILMDNGSLVFAAAGEKLAGGFVVVRVSETSIVIADPSGAEQTVRLRQ